MKLSERIKLIQINLEQHFKFLASLCGVVFLIVATWAAVSFKTNDDKRQAIYDDLGKAAKNLNDISENVKSGTAQIAPTLKGLQEDEGQIRDLISSLNNETVQTGASLRARLTTVDTLIVKLGGIADEGRTQLRQNGDAVALAIGGLNTAIKDADTRVTKLLENGSLLLETANPRVANLLDHTDAVIVDADGAIKEFKPVATNLSGFTFDLHRMSTDSADKWHSILFPPPVKGFWPNVKRAAGFLLTPAIEGTRLYFTVKSLPVRITQPVPILAPKP
jgi:hypothetical protein